ncbi:MAG: DUF4112 domain-containing protein [Pseudomonadota bacterium]
MTDEGETETERESDRLLRGFERLSRLLDTQFNLPFLPRFGLDSLVGLVPVVGDVVTALMGLYALGLAQKHKLPFGTKLGMAWNIIFDMIIGAFPLVGDLFDFFFRAHRRNYKTLKRHLEQRD